MAKIKIKVIAFLILLAPAVFASEYFVDLKGIDTNPGTLAFPFKSIFRASEIAMPGDTVTIKGGAYKLQKPFSPLRSGTSSHWIVYEYLPPDNQVGAPLYRNELEFDFIPEKIPSVKPSGIKWKYEPSPWFGAFKPDKE